jgi:hypothetical protein
MTDRDPLYRRHRFPAEVIAHAVGLYFRFPLSLRMVEDLLAARGIIVSHQTVRLWAEKFGRAFANEIRRRSSDTGRIWTYVRNDRPFGGQSPPAALYYASRDRRQEHPERHLKTFTGILQADAYGGYNPLFKVDRDPDPLRQALCWAHSRRKFFVLADIATNAKRGSRAIPISPMALEAVKRIDALFDIEREINGLAAAERLERRRKDSLRLVGDLHDWLQTERAKLSRSSPVSSADQYSPELPFESSPVCALAGLLECVLEDRRRVITNTLSDGRKGDVGDQAEGDDDDPGFASTGPVGVGDRQADWHLPQDGAQIYRAWAGGSRLWSTEAEIDGDRSVRHLSSGAREGLSRTHRQPTASRDQGTRLHGWLYGRHGFPA